MLATLLRAVERALAALSTCPVCGKRGAGPCGTCAVCEVALRSAVLALPAPSGDTLWLGPHAGAWRRLVHALKYRDARRLAPFLAELLALRARGWGWRPQLVVHLPTTAGRRAARGYDQAEGLARALAPKLGAVHVAALRRVRETPALVRQGRAARSATLEGAFRSRYLGGRAVLLVDDVLTTGATLDAARAALLAAGAREVRAAVVARTALAHEAVAAGEDREGV